jgi:hypothetical protein
MTDSNSIVSLSELLQIPELFETILSHLPIRDLLLHAQLVSRTWHRIISSSPTLQKCLFFAPSPSPLSGASREYNPLLLEKFLPWFLDIYAHIDSREGVYRSGTGPSSVTESTFTFLDWDKSVKKWSAYKRKEASWREMLVAQPAIKELVVEKTCSAMGGTSKREGRVSIEGGLTMGMLYDLVYDQVRVMFTSVVMEWGTDEDEEGVRGLGGKREIGEVRMLIRHTVQCTIGDPPMVGSEFESEAFKPLDIEFGEWVRISRH